MNLSNITDVSTSSQDKSKCDNSFEITTKGKEEQLKLITSSKVCATIAVEIMANTN